MDLYYSLGYQWIEVMFGNTHSTNSDDEKASTVAQQRWLHPNVEASTRSFLPPMISVDSLCIYD